MCIASDKGSVFVRHTMAFRAGHFGIYKIVVRAINGKGIEHSGTDNTAMCFHYISVYDFGHVIFFLPLLNRGEKFILWQWESSSKRENEFPWL